MFRVGNDRGVLEVPPVGLEHVSHGNRPVSTPQDLVDRYSEERLLLSEEMYGPGFQSSGTRALALGLIPDLGLVPGQDFLDLGSGTGGVCYLAATKWGLRATGIDGSGDCIKLAAARVPSSLHLTGSLAFEQQDFRELSLSKQFDGFFTCQSLLYVEEKTECLAEVARNLRPGGKGIVIDYCKTADPLSESEKFRAYLDNCGFDLPTIASYADVLDKAGFDVLRSVDYSEQFAARMQQEVELLQAKEERFREVYTLEQFNHLKERWQAKIDFCRNGELQTAHYLVTPKS